MNNDPTAHGEIQAIRDACSNLKTYDLSGHILYTTAEPCPMCRAAIMWSNIDKVYYGCNVDDTEKIGFRDELFYERLRENSADSDDIEELDREECLKLFEEYEKISFTKYYCIQR